ncbi:MAG: sortase [Anaerolineae bacterium]|nr:sortase [Thermoflexales bacterium]MDW8408188.1 sortase [Anaerolineae bacterium]
MGSRRVLEGLVFLGGVALILAGVAMAPAAGSAPGMLLVSETSARPEPPAPELSRLSDALPTVPIPLPAKQLVKQFASQQTQAPLLSVPSGNVPPGKVPPALPSPAYTVPPEVPRQILIPAIDLSAPIQPVSLAVSANGRTAEWGLPIGRAAGWHNTSARLGESGNLVLNGHHNIEGRVFERLKDLQPGDRIILLGAYRKVTYEVVDRKLLRERGQPIPVRIENARWIRPTSDDRLTLVTCWPPTDNSHRLIVIARPIAEEWLVEQGRAR